MVFSSLIFLYGFLPLVIIGYFLCPSTRQKNNFLIAASLFFYAWGEPLWVLLLILSAATDFICGMLIDRYRGAPLAKAILTFSIVLNIGLLALFKYSGFFVANLNGLFRLSLNVPSFKLPIGISFYTFQTLSYSIDVYRGKVKVQKSFPDFLLFVSLFTQLVAGPILRYSDLEGQLRRRKTTWWGAFYGAGRFICGLGKKVLIANYAGLTANRLLGGNLASLTVMDAWFGIVMFGFQIYFDFSGYSDMAIGLGRIFGFNYPENFNLPYTSKSISEFWRRWHISLGGFFRDYVYIPLGGNKRRHFFNLFIVWFLTGLWHGASWNFIFWGLYFFVFIFIEKHTVVYRERLPKTLRLLLTLFAVELSWVLFYFTDLAAVGAMFKALFGLAGNGFSRMETSIVIASNIPLLLLCIIGSSPLPRSAARIVRELYRRNRERPSYRALYLYSAFIVIAIVLFVSTTSLVGESYNPFLYFRF